MVTTRPADKVKEEASVLIGYVFRKSSIATVEVGSMKVDMYTQDNGAWLRNTAEEGRLIQAMRSGAVVVVKGVPERGGATTDTFSLRGLGQALDLIAQQCS